MDAPTEVSSATGRPTEWATPMLLAGDGQQTIVYASFVSATHISSKTREEVFVVTCAPSQCDGNEVPKQTLTQSIEMYVCPGDSDYCFADDDEGSPTTRFGYPLGWSGDVTADGTTTEWEVKFSMLKDNERSSGATEDDSLTYMATTKVGDDVKATTTRVENVMESGCFFYDNYAFVSVTAGVDELLKDYPIDTFPQEPLRAEDFVQVIEEQRSICARQTSGSSDSASKTGDNGSGPENTDSSSSEDDDDSKNSNNDDEDAAGRTSLSFVLMGALLAVSVLVV